MSRLTLPLAVLVILAAGAAAAQEVNTSFEPKIGQPGKDVIWVPTPEEMVEKMLDMANVTPDDYVIDLGSGDGRNVIAAARRGARALGVEYNNDMVEYSRRKAEAAGVADKARFVQGDMFKADISEASVMALFLLPSNMLQLRSKFLELEPGSRIVSNTFGIEGWEPDRTDTIPDCDAWCNVLLWIVPAKVEGTWRIGGEDLVLKQTFQTVTGTLGDAAIADGRLNGAEIAFTSNGARYRGRVDGRSMEGTVTTPEGEKRWSARQR